MDDKQLQKLIRQNAARAALNAKAAKTRNERRYDPTLPAQSSEEDLERSHFFKEMKKREF